MSNHTVVDAELAVGLVLHLDPAALLGNGSTCSCGPRERVQGAHFFACISRDHNSKTGVWIPLFGDTGINRVEIPTSEKSGHEKWTTGKTYYHPMQTWTVPDATIEPAARAGRDASRQGARNRLKKPADVLRVVDDYIAAQRVADAPAG